MNSSKPKILNILGDRNLGGIQVALDGLMRSVLANEFEFETALLPEVAPLLKQWQPDLVIAHQASCWRQIPTLLWLRLLSPRTKWMIHEHHYCDGFERYCVASRLRFRGLLRLSYGMVDRVVSVSTGQRDWMLKHRLVSDRKVQVIYQACAIDPLLALPIVPVQETLVLAAYGRFCQQKGFDTLIQAMRQLQDLPIVLRLGGLGQDEANLKQLSQGLSNVEFCGKITNLPEFLATCHAVVIPSRWEPWGLVGVEARAAGKPVIAAAVDGLIEQVQTCGILVPADAPDRLAAAIRSLLDQNSSHLVTWGSAGRESIRSAWETYIQEWRNLLQETVSWSSTAADERPPSFLPEQ